jgi:hypothetical protein
MALSVNFRWRGVSLDRPQSMADKTGMGEGLRGLAEGIRTYKDIKKADEERARAQAIQDEEIARRRASEDEEKKRNEEAAAMIRQKAAQRAEIVKRREAIVNRIRELGGAV